MKVTAMTTGEIEYAATVIDQLNNTVPGTSGKDGIPLVPFEDSTYLFYYLFILVMPIALVNLLVSRDSLNCSRLKLNSKVPFRGLGRYEFNS